MANPEGWGSIKEVVNAPLIGVPPDAYWISVILMWIWLPYNLIQGVVAGLFSSIFVCISIGCCCCPGTLCSTYGSVMRGRPLWMAWTWWRYVFAGLIALIRNGKSRLALFMWEWAAFGKGEYWWHGEGVWSWSYADCDKILQSEQERKSAFGCIASCVPDLFAKDLIIFLPNTGGSDSEWAAMRRALHEYFLDTGMEACKERVQKLPEKLAEDWKQPSLQGLNDTARLRCLVSKCIFYMMFGIWPTDAEAKILAGWRDAAFWFILPRLAQRFLFNIGIRKVKKLRQDTVAIIEKYNLQEVFVNMNQSLGDRWRRDKVVVLCDQIMYAVGFAGIGGTCAAAESVTCFLQNKIPPESAAKHIKWGQYETSAKMVEKFKENPEKYIRETCRLDPPVTSATATLKETTKIMLKGREYSMPAGLLNQYVLSMANRDTNVFEGPEQFDPDRANLNKAFTWNGAFGAENEASYPRICPGRHLSLSVVTAVVSYALGAGNASTNAGNV